MRPAGCSPRRGGSAGPTCPLHNHSTEGAGTAPLSSRACWHLRRLPPGASPSRPHMGHASHTHTRKPHAFAGREGEAQGLCQQVREDRAGALHEISYKKASPKRSLQNSTWRGPISLSVLFPTCLLKNETWGAHQYEGSSYPQNSKNIKPSMVGPPEPAVLPSFSTLFFTHS